MKTEPLTHLCKEQRYAFKLRQPRNQYALLSTALATKTQKSPQKTMIELFHKVQYIKHKNSFPLLDSLFFINTDVKANHFQSNSGTGENLHTYTLWPDQPGGCGLLYSTVKLWIHMEEFVYNLLCHWQYPCQSLLSWPTCPRSWGHLERCLFCSLKLQNWPVGTANIMLNNSSKMTLGVEKSRYGRYKHICTQELRLHNIE